MKEKLAMFCNLRSKDHVIHNSDAKTIYEVPMLLQKEGLDKIVCKQLKLKTHTANMKEWKKMVINKGIMKNYLNLFFQMKLMM